MVKQKVVIDSDVIIDYLRQGKVRQLTSKLERLVENKGIIPLLSVATVY